MNLYAGKMLRVNLSEGTVSTEPLKKEWLKEYVGGWGMAVRYFYQESQSGVDPLSPENPVIIMTGAFSGTLAPTSARMCLVSKSPHTGSILESNIGGAFGPELKFAGYDGVVITGKSSKPVFLCIKDDQVTLEDASDLWGKGIFDSEIMLKEKIGSPEGKVLTIGPAGENLITTSCVGSEAYRQMGRGGPGAIFGSKNLKGIVCRGTGAVRVADIDALMAKITNYKETNCLTEDNLWASDEGTAILVEVTNEAGIHPTRNFTYGFNDGKDSLNSEAIQAAKIGDRACTSCPLACGKFTSINGAQVEGPEYETLCLGGSNCEINDLEQVILFNRICDDLGIDTISTGATIAMAMDMTEKGIQDFSLHFGQPEEYLKVLPEIANLSTERGKDLALGVKRLGEKYDAAHLAVHSKGLEFPAYEPRGQYGMGLAYATSERGACHLRAFTVFSETPFDHDAMAQEVVDGQNGNGIKWCMCFCDFWGTVNSDMYADLLTTALGEEVTPEEMDLVGERVWNLTRLWNIREGFGAEQDELPAKILKDALKKGPNDGKTLTEGDLDRMKKRYYEIRQWNENGAPLPEKIKQLGLENL